jgi:hypothetical protein
LKCVILFHFAKIQYFAIFSTNFFCHVQSAVPYQNGQTTQALARIGIALPTIDEGVFGKSLDYMIGSSFLEPPTVSLCQGKVPSTAKSHGIMTRP